MFKSKATGTEKQNAELTQAAERAEARVRDFDAQVAALELETEKADARFLVALADGVAGAALSALSAQRDATQIRLASRRQDLTQVVQSAKTARAAADRARLEGAARTIGAELAVADAALEVLLEQLAKAWQAREVGPAAQARALGVELAAFARQHKTTIAAPTAGAAALTETLYALAGDAGPELGTLALQRREAAHPEPPRTASAPAFLIVGRERAARAQ